MWIMRVLSSTAFLFSTVILIPLAFDVGGRACGLAFSLSLAAFYFVNSILRITTPPRSRFRWFLIKTLGLMQWILMPTLLIWTLNRFSVDADASGGWVERTFGGKKIERQSLQQWIFGPGGLMESVTLASWDRFLRWSIPFFQLCEGFCSLLVIQAAGQISRWLVNRSRGDTWMIGLLVMSASVISSSVYFLWRITTFPGIGNIDATLIGVTITCAIFLCAWGIGSGKGNPVESSLLFAYVVLCIYQIFTDYLPSSPSTADASVPTPSSSTANQPDFPPFPPIVMASYTTLLSALSTLPSTIHSAFTFIVAALSTISSSVLISLAYRLFVFYSSTRIIPAVRQSGARALTQEASLEDTDGAGRLLGLLSWFSPSILISVYTSLLMQHFASSALQTPSSSSILPGSLSGYHPPPPPPPPPASSTPSSRWWYSLAQAGAAAAAGAAGASSSSSAETASKSNKVTAAAATNAVNAVAIAGRAGFSAGGNSWKWINLGGTMALYALELYLGEEDLESSVTSHWKAD